jgi:competence protein ComEA
MALSRSRGAVLLFALAGGLAAAPATELMNLNTASVEQLEALPGLGASRARMVVRVREKNGPFRSVLELRALPRLTQKQFESLSKRLYVEPSTPEKQPRRARP